MIPKTKLLCSGGHAVSKSQYHHSRAYSMLRVSKIPFLVRFGSLQHYLESLGHTKMVLPETQSSQDRLRKEIKGPESSPEPALQYPESVIALIRIS